jgi:4-hydroxybenzoate polyprenyltransferase
LVRPPNLVTVPGDPLLGYFLALSGRAAAGRPAAAATAAALFIYMAGLAWNDVADAAEDAAARPARPIPSGRLPRRAAAWAGAALAAAGLAAAGCAGGATLAAAAGLVALVAAYDFLTRRRPGLGVVNMGLCRGASVLVGAAAAGAAGWPASALAAAGVTLYIVAVSSVALRETAAVDLRGRQWLPALAAALALALLTPVAGRPSPLALAAGALWLAWAATWAARWGNRPPPAAVGAGIGGLIRGLLLFQAAGCALAAPPGPVVSAVLLLGWPLGTFLGRRFHAS